MSYQPPVEIEYGPQRSIKGGIDEAVMLTIEQELNIKVDKDELIRAMRYDRRQYEKGYADGAASQTRHGRWMFLEQKSGYIWKCSNCKGNFDQQFSYCPHCGANMEG